MRGALHAPVYSINSFFINIYLIQPLSSYLYKCRIIFFNVPIASNCFEMPGQNHVITVYCHLSHFLILTMKVYILHFKPLSLFFHKIMQPSFTIQTLLGKMPGNRDEQTDEFLSDTIISKYFSPSEFLTPKIPKKSFSMLHLNIASLIGTFLMN